MRRWMPVALVLAVMLAAFFGLRGAGASEEDRVREAIRQVADGARAADIAMTVAPVSHDYHGPDGLSRDQLKGFLFKQFRSRGPIGVALGPIVVKLEGEDRASASFEAMLVEGVEITALDLAPEDGDVLHFDVQLVQEDGEWRVVSHEQEGVFER
ncbi:MAG: hypothetical protein H6741_32160 [Alphaproteobacteria bacterium]|nr:hypothetical protein [Alphaproteobacteria bacterium]MCB9797368.1 hypothetical protein [Alphaproteobacteria bacterium]